MSAPQRRALLRQFAGFGILPLISAFSPLLVLPVIARSTTPQTWASLLTAQAIGSIAGLIVLMGWSAHGQATVAMHPSNHQRLAIYAESLRSRFKASLVLLPIGVSVGLAVNGLESGLVDSLMLIGSAWTGFSLSWFATACGQSSWILRYELLPRVVATLASVLLIWWTGNIWTYPALLTAASLLGLAWFNRRVLGRWLPRRADDTPPTELDRRELRLGGLFSVIGATYASAPLIVASSLNVQGLEGLATADRLYRYCLMGIITAGNAMQSWALDPSPTSVPRRRIALATFGILGLVVSVPFWLLGHRIGMLMFGSDVAPTTRTCAGYAASYLALSLSTPLIRYLLVPLRRSVAVVWATSISSCVGLMLMIVLGRSWDAPGIAAGLAIAEAVSLACVTVAGGAALSPGRRTVP